MFLFPWLDWGNDISDFEKIDFWPMCDFERFQHPAEAIFYMGHTFEFSSEKVSPKTQFFDIGAYFQGPIGRAQGEYLL